MTINRKLALAGIITVLVAVVSWITVFDPNKRELMSRDDSLAWFESGAFEVGVALADYRSGAGDFLSVIAAEQHKLTAAEDLERNRADYLRRSAELERWAGTTLDRTGHPGSEVNHDYQ